MPEITSDTVIAVTGASSGIGEAIARLLAARGASVVLGARRVARLERIADDVRAHGADMIPLDVDVTRREDLDRLVRAAVDRFGRLDVLVSNAGISKLGPLADGDVDGWSAMIWKLAGSALSSSVIGSTLWQELQSLVATARPEAGSPSGGPREVALPTAPRQ